MLKLLDFYLYSSIHIAISATLFILQTYLLLDIKIEYNYLFFIFSSTLFLYLLHNISGLKSLSNEEVREKTNRLGQMKPIVFMLLTMSAGTSFYSVLFLRPNVILALVFFSFISIWYVVPIFSKKRRLREYPVVKIFLIAFVWAGISAFIPLFEIEMDRYTKALIFFEKYLFIFAITIPFDIRDTKFDRAKGVSTIPIIFGKTKSIILSALSMVFALVIVMNLYLNHIYSSKQFLALLIGYSITMLLIIYAKNKTNDYYFTGMLDGTPILVFLLVLATELTI